MRDGIRSSSSSPEPPMSRVPAVVVAGTRIRTPYSACQDLGKVLVVDLDVTMLCTIIRHYYNELHNVEMHWREHAYACEYSLINGQYCN